MNTLHTPFPHRTFAFASRPFVLVLAVIVPLAVATGLVWALTLPPAPEGLRTQSPVDAVPVPMPPAAGPVAPTPPSLSSPATQPLPEPVPVPTPPTSATLTSASTARPQVPEPFVSATVQAADQSSLIGLIWRDVSMPTGATVLVIMGLLAWAWLRRAMGFHLSSFNG